jgi:hypothetical protein
MKQDRRYEESEYNHLISEAIPFSGYYHAGVMLHEIEQYFCYIGTELQAKEYITVVSSRNLLRDNYQNIIPEISEFTSLEDDISTGKVGISVQGKDGQSIRYKSIFILKNTIMSDACVITFRRDADDETH